MIAALVFLFSVVAILFGNMFWLRRIESQSLLRADEKLQNKDALVIATFFTIMLSLGLCVAGAAASSISPSPAP